MDRRCIAIALVGLALAACATTAAKRPLVDPFPLRFPLVEAGTLDIEGPIAGQPWARAGVVYCPRSDGSVVALVPSSHAVLPEIPAGPPTDGPSRSPDEFVLVRKDRLLTAVDARGQTLWEFRAVGAIAADPVQAGRRIYFGDSARAFYCLDADSGKTKWRRRLQGAAVRPAVVAAGRLAVAATNSVVYRLSRRGGSILSWQAVPSRIIYDLAAAGPLVLISSASPTVTALDMRTGKTVGQYEAPGPLVAGAVWSPPYVVLFTADEETGRQRIIFLRSR